VEKSHQSGDSGAVRRYFLLYTVFVYDNRELSMARIMLIDDDAEFLAELKETLDLSGYETVPVSDSSQAMEIIKATKPALILLDLKMSKKSGFRLANELAYATDIPPIPIIVISAFYSDNYALLLGMYGIKKFVSKPFRPLEIITAIEDVLAQKPTP